MPTKIQKSQLISMPKCFPKVEIKSQDDSTKVFINGNEVKRIKQIKFDQSVDTVPYFEIRTIGRPNIETFGRIAFEFTPQTMFEAMNIIENNSRFQKEIRDAFIETLERFATKEELNKAFDEFIKNFFYL